MSALAEQRPSGNVPAIRETGCTVTWSGARAIPEIPGKPGRAPKQIADSIQRKVKRFFHYTSAPIKDITKAIRNAGGPAHLTVLKLIESHDDGPRPDDVRLKSRAGKKHRHNDIASQAEAYELTVSRIADPATSAAARSNAIEPLVPATDEVDPEQQHRPTEHECVVGTVTTFGSHSRQILADALQPTDSSARSLNPSGVFSASESLRPSQPERWSIDSVRLANELAAVTGESPKVVRCILKHMSLTNDGSDHDELAPRLFLSPLAKLRNLLNLDDPADSLQQISSLDEAYADTLSVRIQQHVHSDENAKRALAAFVAFSEQTDRADQEQHRATNMARYYSLHRSAVEAVLSAEKAVVQTCHVDGGPTPLHIAASLCFSKLCGVLLWAGADANATMKLAPDQDTTVSVSSCCVEALRMFKQGDIRDMATYTNILKCTMQLRYGFRDHQDPQVWQTTARLNPSTTPNTFRKFCNAFDRDRAKQRRDVHHCDNPHCPFVKLNVQRVDAKVEEDLSRKRSIHRVAAGSAPSDNALASTKRRRQSGNGLMSVTNVDLPLQRLDESASRLLSSLAQSTTWLKYELTWSTLQI